MGFALIGYLVTSAVFALGVYFVVTNITLKKQPEKYTYNEDGSVNDHTDKTE